jgi:hypothetical protein
MTLTLSQFTTTTEDAHKNGELPMSSDSMIWLQRETERAYRVR